MFSTGFSVIVAEFHTSSVFVYLFVCFPRSSSATEELALTQQNLRTKEALADDLDTKIQTSQKSAERKSE